MDTESQKDLVWLWEQFWSSLVVALAVYGGGLTANRIALAFVPSAKDYLDGKTQTLDLTWPLLFRAWAVTRVAHPFFVGGAIAFIPGLPWPEMLGTQTSATLWFSFVAMMNGQIHAIVDAVGKQTMKLVALIVPWVRARLGLPASPSSPPPALTVAPKPVAPVASDPDPSTETSLDLDAEREAMEAEVSAKVEEKKK